MKLIATIVLTLLLQNSFAQIADNTNRHNDRNIYFQTLKQYLDFRATDAYYSRLKQIDTLYVYNETKITDSLLQRIGSTEIILIKDPYAFIKSNGGKGIALYSIFPLEFRVCLKNIHRAENASFETCLSRLFRAISPIIPRKRALSQNPKSAIFISGNVFQTHSKQEEFSVSFVPFGVSIDKKRKKTLSFSNPGSYKVIFKYDNGLFHFVRIEDHGI